MSVEIVNERGNIIFSSEVAPFRFMQKVEVPYSTSYTATWPGTPGTGAMLAAVDIPEGAGVWWGVYRRGATEFPTSYYNRTTLSWVTVPSTHYAAIRATALYPGTTSTVAKVDAYIFDRVPSATAVNVGLEVYNASGVLTLSSASKLLSIDATASFSLSAFSGTYPRIHLGTYPDSLIYVGNLFRQEADYGDGDWEDYFVYVERVGNNYYASSAQRGNLGNPGIYSHTHRLDCAFIPKSAFV